MKTKQINWNKLSEDHKYYNMCLIAHLQQLTDDKRGLDALDIVAHCSKCIHHKASKQSAAVNCTKPFVREYNDINCDFETRNPCNSSAY